MIEYVKTGGYNYTYSVVKGNVPDVVLNPGLDLQLVGKKVKFITSNHACSWVDSSANTFNTVGVPSGMGLELTFSVDNATKYSDRELKAIRSYPLGLTHTTVYEDNGPEY